MALWENPQVALKVHWDPKGEPRTLPRESKKVLLQELTTG